jgi:UDP-glucose:(heptosyl)LPS alpha-1,3-glucosyltransferase
VSRAIAEYAVAVKIALVILHADTARGGAERYTLDLAKALVKRGHDVSILASSFQSEPLAGKQVLIAARANTRTGRYEKFLLNLDSELTLARIQGKPFDVVHAMLPVRNCDIYHPHAGIAKEVVT